MQKEGMIGMFFRQKSVLIEMDLHLNGDFTKFSKSGIKSNCLKDC